jgi:lysophospholipase L1-like esterase
MAREVPARHVVHESSSERSRRYLLPIVALWLGLCGAVGAVPNAPAPTAPAAASTRGIWVVLGSSTAAGTGVPAGQGWVSLLEAAYRPAGVSIRNLAVAGTVTYHALPGSLWPSLSRPSPKAEANVDAALALAPRLLLLAYPSNDTARGYSIEETVSNLLAIRQVSLAKGIAVLVLSTQPRNLSTEQRASLSLIDQQLRAAVGPCFVATSERLATPDGLLRSAYDSGDGVHPNAEGHRQIADQVQAVINGGKCVRPPIAP